MIDRTNDPQNIIFELNGDSNFGELASALATKIGRRKRFSVTLVVAAFRRMDKDKVATLTAAKKMVVEKGGNFYLSGTRNDMHDIFIEAGLL